MRRVGEDEYEDDSGAVMLINNNSLGESGSLVRPFPFFLSLVLPLVLLFFFGSVFLFSRVLSVSLSSLICLSMCVARQ